MAEKIEVLRERNKKLLEQIEELKFKIENNEQLNTKSYVKAKELIEALEDLKNDWSMQLRVVLELQEEYHKLIKDVTILKTGLQTYCNKK